MNLTGVYNVLTKLQDEQKAMKERHENVTAELREKLSNVTKELETTKEELDVVKEVLKIG